VKESAIVANLDPGSYRAIVRGNKNKTGVGTVEVYALPQQGRAISKSPTSIGGLETAAP
jgi:hypothetical protein